MKTNSRLIVMLTVILSTVSVATAEIVNVNFDQRLPKTERQNTFSAIESVENNFPAISASIAVENANNKLFHKLDIAGLKVLRKEISSIPGISKEFNNAISGKNVTVFYNKLGVSLVSQISENEYIMLWESNSRVLDFLANRETEVVKSGTQDKTDKLSLTRAMGDNIPPDAPDGFGGPYGGGGGGNGGGGGPCSASTGPVADQCGALN